jgi:hypothetical protein
VTTHRSRDVAPEIRAATVEGLGAWICACPADFLTDTYLKYIGWALSDRVRCVLPCLSPSFSHRECHGNQHVFINRACAVPCTLARTACYLHLFEDHQGLPGANPGRDQVWDKRCYGLGV